MSPKICRNLIAVAALAAALTSSPAQAAGPQLRYVRPESPWTAVSSAWNAVTQQLASWWKSQPPSPQQHSCRNGNAGCSSNPKPPSDVGSAIDPDGKP